MGEFLGVFIVLAVPALIWFAIAKARQSQTHRMNEVAGTFQVDGVDRETRQDVSRNIEAASAENAKAKAELAGMVVTRVFRR